MVRFSETLSEPVKAAIGRPRVHEGGNDASLVRSGVKHEVSKTYLSDKVKSFLPAGKPGPLMDCGAASRQIAGLNLSVGRCAGEAPGPKAAEAR